MTAFLPFFGLPAPVYHRLSHRLRSGRSLRWILLAAVSILPRRAMRAACAPLIVSLILRIIAYAVGSRATSDGAEHPGL